MKSKINSHGQIEIIDLVFSTFIILIVILGALMYWYVILQNAQSQFDQKDIEKRANEILDVLLTSPGLPTNWEDGNAADINFVGLASRPLEIDTKKLTGFINLNYASSKTLLNTLNYDYYFKLTGPAAVTAGLPVFAPATTIKVERIAVYSGSEAKIEFTLYKVRP